MKNLKCHALACVAALFSLSVHAQNVGINEDGSAPNPNAILDLKSSNKGFLLPRVNPSTLQSITPVNGMLVYDESINSFWVGTGFQWKLLIPPLSTPGWSIIGNSGNGPGYFLGTTDAQPLRFRVNNQPSGLIDSLSQNAFFGFGTNVQPPDNSGFGSNFSNSGFGYYALHNNFNGFYNTASGARALMTNLLGSFNTAIGADALHFNSNSSNTATGYAAQFNTTTGHSNTSTGAYALYNNLTGSGNTALGYQADIGLDGITNATALGYQTMVNTSNKVRIGNSAVTVIEGQVPFTTPSDGRYKYQVREDVKGLDFILQLRPVTYQFDVKKFDDHLKGNAKTPKETQKTDLLQTAYTEASAIRRSGFIAQEVERAADSSGYNFSGIIRPKTDADHYSLSYESFVVPLVKAVQEQQRIILDQQKQLTGLQQQIDELKKLLTRSR